MIRITRLLLTLDKFFQPWNDNFHWNYDAEWRHLAPYVPPPKAGGRPRHHAIREILNAMFYILRSECA
jgi:transposase